MGCTALLLLANQQSLLSKSTGIVISVDSSAEKAQSPRPYQIRSGESICVQPFPSLAGWPCMSSYILFKNVCVFLNVDVFSS